MLREDGEPTNTSDLLHSSALGAGSNHRTEGLTHRRSKDVEATPTNTTPACVPLRRRVELDVLPLVERDVVPIIGRSLVQGLDVEVPDFLCGRGS